MKSIVANTTTQIISIIFGLLTITHCIQGTHQSASPRRSHPPTVSFAEDGEEWRKHLPEKLSDRNGAPLHKFVVESASNPPTRVTVYLLGTSHVSRTSCEDAKLLMEYARPDVLFVELCSHRVGLLFDPAASEAEEGSNKDASEDNNTPPDGMSATSQKMSLLFTKIQADYAKKLNVTIGGEFRSAFQSALIQQKQYWREEYLHRHSAGRILNNQHNPCAIILGDRPVRITLSRAWESLRFFGKCKLVLCLLWSSIKQPSEKELREWMESILNDRTGKNDLMTKAMEDMGKAFPSIKKVIIEERDEFMSAKLKQCAEMLMQMKDDNRQHRVIVAVVGAGHCSGMMEQLLDRSTTDRPEVVLPALVETRKRTMENDEEVSSLVTDVVQFDYEYAMQNAML